MYKFADKDHKTVANLITGASGIRPGNWMWEQYQMWVESGGVTEPFDARTSEQVMADEKVDQEREIRSQYAAMLVSITAPYGEAERETWKTQEEEAQLWTPESDGLSGEIDLCPMIRGMATARGILMNLMVAKILKNAELFRAASGQILGMQQAELDLLYPERKEEV